MTRILNCKFNCSKISMKLWWWSCVKHPPFWLISVSQSVVILCSSKGKRPSRKVQWQWIIVPMCLNAGISVTCTCHLSCTRLSTMDRITHLLTHTPDPLCISQMSIGLDCEHPWVGEGVQSRQTGGLGGGGGGRREEGGGGVVFSSTLTTPLSASRSSPERTLTAVDVHPSLSLQRAQLWLTEYWAAWTNCRCREAPCVDVQTQDLTQD